MKRVYTLSKCRLAARGERIAAIGRFRAGGLGPVGGVEIEGLVMIAELALPLSIALGLVVFGLVARWYLVPLLARVGRDEALVPFLLFHAFRYVGLAFLIPGVTAGALDPRFAAPAAYGDLVAALLALVAVAALRLRWTVAVPLVWLFNVAGTLDLFNAVYRGFLYTPDGHLGATYFIPAVLVPALLVSHALVSWLLLRRAPAAETLATC